MYQRGDRLEINEVSEIEIQTFIVEDVRKFDNLSLHDKLKNLKPLIGTKNMEFHGAYAAIGLGDAFQRTINAMHKKEARVAVITERRVVTILQP